MNIEMNIGPWRLIMWEEITSHKPTPVLWKRAFNAKSSKNNNLQTNKKNQANLAEDISSRSHILWHSDIQRLYLRIRRVNHHELGSDDPLVPWLCTFLEMHRSRIRYSGKWLNIAHFLLLAHLLRLERLFGSLNGNSSSNSSNSGLFSHGSLMTPFIHDRTGAGI